jgi:aspartate racemase
MKKIGLIGGISWVSTIDYYRYINEGVNSRLGGINFAECLLYSLNFADVQERGWPNAYELILNACKDLKKGNVQAIVLCANTAHQFAENLQEEIQLPVIHIVEETAKEICKRDLKKVGLLGTKFTMEMDFYTKKFNQFGIEVIVPEQQETRDYIQHTLKEELGIGLINPDTKKNYIEIANDLVKNGAEGIILGCTEIPLLISQNDFELPVFDTTKIHAKAIVDFMLS